MPEELLSSENVSSLIDHLMNSRDPATVGLRRILKKKERISRDFPLQSFTLENFSHNKGAGGKVFSENEQLIMELEKKQLTLEEKLARQKEKSERAIQEAYKTGIEKGTQRGEASGYERATAEYGQKIKDIEERLISVFGNIEESRKTLFNEANKAILDLSILIARKIVNTELSVNPDIVLTIIKKALSHLADRQEFVARVSPDDISTVTEKKEFWTQISDRLDKITIKEDERIERGGCIIESDSGIIDARINTQIGELVEVINTTWDDLMTNEDGDRNEDFTTSTSADATADKESTEPTGENK